MALLTRGDVYEVRLPAPRGRGHEQVGQRYAVILQVDELMVLSTAIIAPTSRSARPATFRPEIEIGTEPTRLLLEQLRAVDIERLGTRVGHLTIAEAAEVDRALAMVIGL